MNKYATISAIARIYTIHLIKGFYHWQVDEIIFLIPHFFAIHPFAIICGMSKWLMKIWCESMGTFFQEHFTELSAF